METCFTHKKHKSVAVDGFRWKITILEVLSVLSCLKGGEKKYAKEVEHLEKKQTTIILTINMIHGRIHHIKPQMKQNGKIR